MDRIGPPPHPPTQAHVANGLPLEANDIWAGYGNGPDVLEGVALRLVQSELCALVGPNGSGKSTIVRVLSGLLAPRRGSVRVCGADLPRLARAAIARRIAVVPQIVEVAFGFRTREVVMMGRAPHQSAWMRASANDARAVDEALEACELADLADRPVSELSGGEQQRVAIARALAQDARVLLLDEPAAHLDIRNTVRVHALLRRQTAERGLAVLAVLHDLNVAASFADRVILLGRGQVIAEGAPREVMTASRLTELFGRELEVTEIDGRRVFLPSPGSRPSAQRDL